jgi:hypothetical protein
MLPIEEDQGIAPIPICPTAPGGSCCLSCDYNPHRNANVWHTLGEFQFGDGVNGSFGVHSVRVSNDSLVITTPQNRFYSGAARFDFVGPLPPPATVADWSMY